MTSVVISPDAWMPDIKAAPEPASEEKLSYVLPSLPDEFWESRLALRRIRQGARAALAGPDMVFLSMICRNAAMASPDLMFDIGAGKGSLNFYGALVGGTGIGKTTANNVAMDMLLVSRALSEDLACTRANPDLFKDGIGVGTGEGLIEAYMDSVSIERERNGKPVKERVRQQVRKHCYFFVDEGEALGQLMAREGATLGSILRSAWPGAPVGQQNASSDKTRFLTRHSYSLGLNVGFQPEIMQFLLADGAAGTPQRFLMLSGYDPALPDEDLDPVPAMTSPVEDENGRPLIGVITGPDWLRRELRENRKGMLRGERSVAQLDSQKPAMLGKLASHLCLLDGRLDINDEDWQLTGVVWDTHSAIVEMLVELGRARIEEEVRAKRDVAVDIAVASHQKVADDIANVERVARNLWRKVSDKGAMPLTSARHAVAYRDRVPFYDRALATAQARDWLVVEDGKVATGGHRPLS